MGRTKEADITDITERKITVENDGELLISTGASRFETSWKNKKRRWSALLSRLSSSQATGETHAEYMKLPKDQQDKLKDIGGFVGGTCKEGHRKTGSVTSRQILTLDVDFAPPDLWDRLMDLTLDGLDCAMAIYSTHKHCEAKPRLRLIMPLAEEVTPDEYEAMGRKIAEKVGIDFFDDSTYQATRLMYWPSHSADVQPVFKYYDAPFLDPGEILKLYHDWTDVSEWPMSSRELEIRKKLAEKQGDPTEKRNIVGVFCRTYTVTEAIAKFIPDVYVPTAKEDRWTYAAGSTSGGLVIYDGDLFAYSNHGTDPAGGQLCNAFDLVRIHKFGSQDEGSEDKPMNRRPSWKAMAELMEKDPECIRTHDSEAAQDFSDGYEDKDWATKLIRNEMRITAALVNATTILECDERLQGLRLNSMSGRIEVNNAPWEEGKTMTWSDTQDAILVDWIAREYGVEFPAAKIRMAIAKAAYKRQYHPVKDYLEGLPSWDGTERVDRLLVDYLGADDNAYTREATRKTLVAAVARIYRPGIKFDYMLVLVGPQGAGKSTLFAKLARGDWFSDSLKMDMMNKIKDAGEQLQGRWIVEIGEMSGMKKADVESVKSFVSRQSDDYRAAYGHYSEDRPRQCIIVGSTNSEEGFLRDVTGNRRFWPVHVKKLGAVKTAMLTTDEVDQIWAEAKMRYKAGEGLLLSRAAEALAEDAQREAMEQDDRQGIVEDYLDRLVPKNWDALSYDQRMLFLDGEEEGTELRQTVSNIEIWTEALHGSKDRMESKDSYAIAKIMAKIPGWKKTGKIKRVTTYGRQRVYERSESNK